MAHMVRQAHHERNQTLTLHPVEGFNQQTIQQLTCGDNAISIGNDDFHPPIQLLAG
jgi:hypothetical protein